MAQFLKIYLKALAVVALAMSAYCLAIVPWIEPRELIGYSIPDFTGLSSGDRWWESIFPAKDWQNQQPTVVHNSRGVLLAKTWEQVDQRTWKLTPLTIVLTQFDTDETLATGAVSPQDVWVINAREGATIHFDQPLDLNSGRVPSIERGQLDGEINIQRLSLSDLEKPNLQMKTRNLSIDRRQIWTQEEVQVTSSDLTFSGRMLRIHLLGDILSQNSGQAERESVSRSGPLEEIELMHLAELKIRLQDGGIWSGVNASFLQLPEGSEQLPASIEAECGGRFSLNFSKEIAILNGGVHFWHFLGNLPPDEFQCHRLQVRFQSNIETKAAEDSSATQQILHGLTIRDIEAFGIDSLEDFVGEMWVEMKSPLVDASVRAKRVRYDLSLQRFELAGKLNQPGATASVAELNFRGFQFHAPMLEYQAPPKSSDGRALHGGWMVAQGAGEVSSPANSELGQVQVRWQDSFHWSPADAPGEQLVEIVGRTLVENSQKGFVTADRLQLWLANPVQPPESSSQGRDGGNPVLNPPGNEFTRSTQDSAANNFRPRRLITSGPTLIRTGENQLQVESMDLQFVYPPQHNNFSDPDLALQDSSGNSMFQFLTQPGAKGTQVSANHSDQSQRSIQMVGKYLVASVVVADRIWVDSMTLQGPLSLTSEIAASTPIKLLGDTLIMATTPDGKVDMEIEGSPAEVTFADGSIQGPSIRFNERENHIWMDRPGQFTLPTSLVTGTGLPDTLQWQVPLRCSWEGRMLFDGKTFRLDGGIRINGALQRSDRLWLMEGICKTMDIHLAKSLNLQDLNSTNQGLNRLSSEQSAESNHLASISHIALRSDVDLRIAQRDQAGQRVSLQRLLVPEFTIYVPQEKIVATGPGQGIAKFYAGRPVGALASSSEPAVEQLQCAHLTFRDSLTGLLGHNEIVVDGNVKIVSSPISNWDANFDPYSITRLSPGQISLSSDQVKMFDTSSLNSTQHVRMSSSSAGIRLWEIQATGNVVFEGSAETGAYSGNAYQVSYVQAKDLLTLRGDGRSKAILRRMPPANTPSSYPTVVQVPVASLNVKTMAVDVPQGGLDIQVDFQNDTGGINSSDGEGRPSNGLPIPTQPPNPRDGIKNFLRGY